MKIRIKVCGVLTPEDAELVVEAGADLIGLNFVPGSPRLLDLAQAEAIANQVGSRAERVGVFRNAEPEEIERVLRRVDLDRLQFHGDETEEEVEAVDLPVIKAIQGADLERADEYPGTIVLLDHPSGNAGAGAEWDWASAAELIESGHDVILAGGLSPGNVARALAELGDLPWGVDVATGVEVGPGDHRKDPEKVKAFIASVREAEEVDVPTASDDAR